VGRHKRAVAQTPQELKLGRELIPKLWISQELQRVWHASCSNIAYTINFAHSAFTNLGLDPETSVD
jgi:hypothetical protein